MIIQFVKFKTDLPDMEVRQMMEKRMPQYHAVPGLLQKYYFWDNQTGEYGAIFLWDSDESRRRFQQSELARSVPVAYKISDQPRVEVLNVLFTLRPNSGSR